ncbi:MAG: DUF3500 domain-containing protein [Bacteroidota bacterium]
MNNSPLLSAIGILLIGLTFGSCRQTSTTATAETAEGQTVHLHTHVSTAMLAAAEQFLGRLEETQREAVIFPFTDSMRYNWHFIPMDSRIGIPLEEMNELQREAAANLMRSTLSEQGYEKIEAIRGLELVLREVENRPPDDRRRHPEKYYFAFFGSPSADAPWAWRYEGHHTSLSFSSVNEELVAVTPAFLGSNPAIVREGSNVGMEVLKAEQDLGREFVKGLAPNQLEKALILEEAPGDVLTFVDREIKLTEFEGLAASEMNADQQQELRALLQVYTGNMQADIAADQWRRIEESGFEKLYFAWAGSLEPGEGHYYRIHGPTLLIEYDNVQNNNNHVHTVWRDLQYDFGGDLLQQHYENSDHH